MHAAYLCAIAALVAASHALTCADSPLNDLPFCNVSLPWEERATDLVSRMNLTAKISQFGTSAAAIEELGVPAYEWWNEGLHGVAFSPGVKFVGKTQSATSFPEIIGLSATWNLSLVTAMGQAISDEARAFSNQGNAGLTFFTPNINIFRDPRWGRGQETPGEDPFYQSQYVTALVTALQTGIDSRYFKLVATCKHFTAYDLEDWGGVNRYHFDAIVSDQDLVESFLPSFEACVKDAYVASIMCSYNAVNGVPSCANGMFNNDMIRDDWGFTGYIVGDCGAVSDIMLTHHYTNTTQATCAAALGGGCDLDCGTFLTDYLETAINDGAVTEVMLDQSLVRLFGHRIQLGYFDPLVQQPYKEIPVSVINSEAHQQLALDAARQSMVLLQNPGILPLSLENIQRVALIGPNADATLTLQGNYYGPAPYLISPKIGFEQLGLLVDYIEGCPIAHKDPLEIPAAAALAKVADATILVLGLDQSQESEGHDRTSIAMPGLQWDLYDAVKAAARGPVVVVVMSGGPVDLTKLLDEDVAVMWVGYPGQSGGQAIAETVFGLNNPAGRLTVTVYPAIYVDEVPMTNMTFRGVPGRTYKWYQGASPFPFGTGLSYTTFSYVWANPALAAERAVLKTHTVAEAWHRRQVTPKPATGGVVETSDPTWVSYQVNVTNTGAVAGDDVVLAFISRGDDPTAPLQELFGFSRVSLAPGQSTDILFAPEASFFTVVDEKGTRHVKPGSYKVRIGEITQELDLVGEAIMLREYVR